MVGDAEDLKRWKRYHELRETARRTYLEAIDARTSHERRLALLERAEDLSRYAHHLTV